VTHTGAEKPFYFEENIDKFDKFLDKIIHVKVEDTPEKFYDIQEIINPTTFDKKEVCKIHKFVKEQKERFNVHTQPDYGRDFYQKECIRRALKDCRDDDIIISSDVDEIPNPKIIKRVRELEFDRFYTFNQDFYCYYLNVLKERDWGGSRMGSYEMLKDYSYNELRAAKNISIPNGGWHFSFMGGAEKVKTKITSYSAFDLVDRRVYDSVEENIQNNVDPFFRGNLQTVEMDNSYPEYLLDNLKKYEHLIRKTSENQ
jgi:beta-1,4-mannosyl-glycoprotein beta-1,4-N-acetylglucosaminyltransferase